MQFASNVRKIRRESRLPPKVFAEFVGIHTSTLRRIEAASPRRAHYNPALSTVTKVAAATNLSVEDLINSQVETVLVQ